MGGPCKVILILLISLILMANYMPVVALEQNSIESIGYVKHLEIYIVYDNYVFNEKLKPSWGVSFYIIADDNVILFDTGGDGEILISNMRELNLKPEDIKVIVLSHIHGDHIGGLYKLLSINSKVIVYLPSSFPRDVKDEIKQFGAKIVEVSGPTIICNGVASTGEIPSGIGLYEQALIINTTLGPLILTGCAHPGVDNIVVKVAEMMKCSSILLVGGGFHLASASDSRILKIIDTFKRYNVKLVMPIHCSGV